MPSPIQAIHHVTVYAADPQRNVDFYTQVLGQRLVKTTVNFDDPSLYHLYYGDNVGSPGTIMTFFPLPYAAPGRPGNGEIGAAAYAIAPESLDYWRARLVESPDVGRLDEETRFGESVLTFKDPDGLALELVACRSDPAPTFWADGPVPAEHALRGFHSVTLWEERAEVTADLLTNTLGYRLAGEEGMRLRFEGAGSMAQFVDILVNPTLVVPGRRGAGTVHHVAFRTPGDAEQLAWRQTVSELGLPVTPVRDRRYFHSIYFNEPGGVLFEIATDAPGFAVDEPVEALGQSLRLPPWLEARRERIAASLKPLRHPEAAA